MTDPKRSDGAQTMRILAEIAQRFGRQPKSGVPLLQFSLLRACAFGIALSLALAVVYFHANVGVDESLRLARDRMHPRLATGNIALVEIDAKSLSRISTWPWPRRLHGQLIDTLREAGAAKVAFDVDFSATTNPDDDRLFGEALGRFGGAAILPTFRQPASSSSREWIENLPVATLRDHAFLGSVNVQPDSDGQLRRFSYGTVTGGVPRPALAALLADTRGRIGESFSIDSAIDPASILRLSYADVLTGAISAEKLRGKAILVGATAIEMGDRYAVPGRGVLPGALIQVLAAETLAQGTTNPNIGPWPALILAILGTLVLSRRRRALAWCIGAAALIGALPLALELAGVGTLEIVPALTFLALETGLLAAIATLATLREARLVDAETGLPNLRALLQKSRQIESLTIVVLRMKQFSEMNAILSAADRKALIMKVNERLQLSFPDIPIYMIEAGTLAVSIKLIEMDELIERVEGLCSVLRSAIDIGSRTVLVTPAFGMSSGEGRDAAQLVAEASLAAHQAATANQRWTLHSDQHASDADRSLILLSGVDDALANGEIHVLFQPKWLLGEGRVGGAEALVRWKHPLFGPVPPDQFIPLLEDNGHIEELTLFVVDACIAQLSGWRAMDQDINLAVNISAVLLDKAGFVDQLAARITDQKGLAESLTFEVTESATLTGAASAIASLTRLRALGVRISIDDYGTGQSTLTYLKSFPADEIKIDKSFVTRMGDSKSDQILVRSTIELAHELGFKVVAEGVEDGDCLKMLAQYGCDVAQGWHIGRPETAEAFEQRLYEAHKTERHAA
jgi:diguanylate cyclase